MRGPDPDLPCPPFEIVLDDGWSFWPFTKSRRQVQAEVDEENRLALERYEVDLETYNRKRSHGSLLP